MLIYIAIGAGVVALILLIVVISKVKNRRKKTDNDKILQELAGKYQSNTPVRQVPEEPAMTGEAPVQTAVTAPKQEPAPQPAEEAPGALVDPDMFDDEEYTGRKYSDADIARLLGDVEDDENFIEALSAEEAAPDDTEDMDSVTDTADDTISEFFEDAPEASEKEPTEEAIPDAVERKLTKRLKKPQRKRKFLQRRKKSLKKPPQKLMMKRRKKYPKNPRRKRRRKLLTKRQKLLRKPRRKKRPQKKLRRNPLRSPSKKMRILTSSSATRCWRARKINRKNLKKAAISLRSRPKK